MPKIDFNAPEFSEQPAQSSQQQPAAGGNTPAPKTEPLGAPAQPAGEEEVTFGAAAQDLAMGVAGGVEDMVRGVRQVGKILTGDETPLPPPLIEDPKGLPAKILRSATQFAIGWGVGGAALKGVGLAAKLGETGTAVASQGLGTALVADAHAPNLSNIIQEYPFLRNPVTDFLEAKPDDSLAVGKLKAAFQDMGLQAAGSLLYKLVVGTKAAQLGDEATVKAMQAEVSQELAPKAASVVDANPAALASKVEAKAATAAAEAAPKPAVQVLGETGEPIFQLSKEQHQLFQDQVGAMVRSGNTEDVVRTVSSVFNHDRLSSPHDVLKVVESMSDMVEPALAKAGLRQATTMSNEATQASAYLLSKDVDQYLALMRPLAKNANDMPKVTVAGRILVESLADQVQSLASRVYIGDDMEAAAQLAKVAKLYEEVFGGTSSIRTGAARATQAGNITTHKIGDEVLQGVGQEAGKKSSAEAFAKNAPKAKPISKEQGIADAIKSAGGEENVRMLAQRIVMADKDRKSALAQLTPQSLGTKLLNAHNEIWINGILSGIKTHVVNVTSNTVKTLATPLNQIVGGVIRRDMGDVKEGIALYRGLRQGLFDSLDMARRAFTTDKAILDPGRGTNEYFNRAFTSSYFDLKEGSVLANAVDAFGKVIRFPGRFLTAEDEFFKQINYRAKTMAQAAREAQGLVNEGKLSYDTMVEHVLDGKATKISQVEKYIQDRFQSAFTTNGAAYADRTKALNADALHYARSATFTQDLNIATRSGGMSVGASLQRVAASHPFLRGSILPFVKVPTNIMRDFVDHSPLAFLTQRYKQDIAAGGTRASLAMGKLSMGTALGLAATWMAMEGRITGAAPGDPDMKERWKESGRQPYSLVLGDGPEKTYVSLQRIDPWGMIFGLAADFHQTAMHLDGDTRHNFAVALALSIANNLESKSYLQGIVEFSSLFGSGYSKEDIVERMAQRRVASYVPAYANLWSGNEEVKALRNWYDGAMAKLPGWAPGGGHTAVEAKRDFLTGEKKLAPDGYPWNAINPYTVSKGKGDPVRDELARLSQSQAEAKFSLPETKVGNVDLTTIRNKNGQSAYDRWTELIGTVTHGGQTFRDRLKSVMDSERYKNGTDGTSFYNIGSRIAQIKNVHEMYKNLAQHQMMKEFTDAVSTETNAPVNLRSLLKDDKINEHAMKAGRPNRMRAILNLNNQ